MASNYAPKQLARTALGSSEATLFTATSGKGYIIKQVIFCNETTNPRTVRLFIDTRSTVYDYPVPAKDTVILDLNQVITGTDPDTISGNADAAASVSVQIAGVEYDL